VNRDIDAQRPSIALAPRPSTELSELATPCFPWQETPRSPTPGSATRRSARGHRGFPCLRPRAARRTDLTAGHLQSSRAAVTAATSRGGSTPSAGSAQASGLTADPAHNRPPFAGRAQLASQTHMPLTPTPRLTAEARATAAPAPGTATPTAPGRAHAPVASPQPSRLTPSSSGVRPLNGLPFGREAASLPAAGAATGDAARIAAPCSAPATPEAGASAAQGVASSSAAASRTAASTHTTSAFRLPTYPQEAWAGRKAFASTDFDITTAA
jgi:hypothetical protein